jgi:adenylosuccinate synthase
MKKLELKELLLKRLRSFFSQHFGPDFLKSFRVIAIVCLIFGDSGKGKISHLLAWLWAHVVARGGGGDNAGHTVIHNGKEMVFHLLPCGIPFDSSGVINIIGSGVVIYPKACVDEIKLALTNGLTCYHLKIALNAKLILPDLILDDRFNEFQAGKTRIGTTGKGMGPTYTAFVGRKGFILNDILNPGVFRSKFLAYIEPIIKRLKALDEDKKAAVKKILFHENLESGLYYSEESIFNVDAIIAKYLEYGEYLRTYICNTDGMLQGFLGKKNILLEGAQGYLLSIDHGTYPYVTSSDCSPAGLAKGVGLRETDIDVSFGIVKGYPTRVGKGPFPTEIGGEESEVWCNENGSRDQEKNLEAPDINHAEPFFQGVALRRIANEYGATTGRPRRIGWIDLPLLRHALESGAKHIILTKLDVLTGLKKINVCYAYEYDGPDFYFGGDIILRRGDTIEKAILLPEVLPYCKPLYKTFSGWRKDISKAKSIDDLPVNFLKIQKYIFQEAPGIDAVPSIISVGPAPEETIFLGVDDL